MSNTTRHKEGKHRSGNPSFTSRWQRPPPISERSMRRFLSTHRASRSTISGWDLGRHFGRRLHQKVRRPHPHLQRAKRMLDRLATSTHCIRISVQARLNSIDNILVLPPLDATLRSVHLQRAGAARVGPESADVRVGPRSSLSNRFQGSRMATVDCLTLA